MPLDSGAHFDAAGDEQGEFVVLRGNGGFAVVKQRVRSQCWGRRRDELVKDVWDFGVKVSTFAGSEGVLFTARTAARSLFLLGRLLGQFLYLGRW